VGRVPISDLCDQLGLQPTVFYRWQKEFFENGAAAFSKEDGPTVSPNRNELLNGRIQDAKRFAEDFESQLSQPYA